MTPEAALKMQIERYRRMTCEQRVVTALGLHELACEIARLGVRRQLPKANEARVNVLLRERLKLVRAA